MPCTILKQFSPLIGDFVTVAAKELDKDTPNVQGLAEDFGTLQDKFNAVSARLLDIESEIHGLKTTVGNIETLLREHFGLGPHVP